ncbi:MAG: hypothetical protein ACLTZI_01405 [[Eubacterium] siraeum]
MQRIAFQPSFSDMLSTFILFSFSADSTLVKTLGDNARHYQLAVLL